MSKIAIVGWRDHPNKRAVVDYVGGLQSDDVVISGGARGVDSWAVACAMARGLQYQVFEAQWDYYRPADPTKKNPAGVHRNTQIVAEADVVVAFWDGKSPGTRDTITKARKAGKFLGWFDPAGEWHDERTGSESGARP